MHRDRTILIIDDDRNFVLLMAWALAKAGLESRLIDVNDGREALRYFQGAGRYADRQVYPVPSVVLLDLYLPLLDGNEVLHWLRRRSEFATLPVLVLTSSQVEISISQASEATAFRQKPFSMDDMVTLGKELGSRWLTPRVASRELQPLL